MFKSLYRISVNTTFLSNIFGFINPATFGEGVVFFSLRRNKI